MAVPPKPWNSGVINNRSPNMNSIPVGGSRAVPYGINQNVSPQQPNFGPPVPPRPDQVTNSPFGYSRYATGYNRGYQRNMFGQLNSGIGGLGYNNQLLYGSDFYGGDRFQNSFIRYAEENSRSAFQSIESLVNGVNSISFMLESTFQAFQNSYQAILGVADQFSRFRSHMIRMISALAFLRNIRWLLRRILYFLGLNNGFTPESAWDAASKAADGSVALPNSADPSKNSWPVLLFVGIILVGPCIISRLFSKGFKEFQGKHVSSVVVQDNLGWASGKEDYVAGIAAYDFRSASTRELSFRAGQKIRIAPKHLQLRNKDWLVACVDGKNIGLVPANYIGNRQSVHVKPKPSNSKLSSTKSTRSPVTMPSNGAQQVLESVLEKDSGGESIFAPLGEEKTSA